MVTIAWWRQTVRLASDQQDAQTNSSCQHEKHGISWPWTRCPSSSARQCRNGEPCTKPLAGRGSGQWRGARRRMPVPGSLLVTVADTDQNRLAPRPAQNLKAGRQVSAHETHRNGHRRKPGRRRNAWAVVAVRRVEIADQPRRVIPGWIDQCVQFRVIHRRLYGLRQTLTALLRDDAARVALRRRLSLRVAHPLLDRRMEFPRGKDLVEGLDRRLRTERSEIRRDVVLEAVAEQVSERDLVDLGDVDTVDDLRALPFHIDQRLLHQVENSGVRIG